MSIVKSPRAMMLTLSVIAALFAGNAGAAERLSGTVTDVIDGDTLRVNTPGCQDCRVRLADIDAPEHDQPYGAQARAALARLTGGVGATITLLAEGRDRYGRILAHVLHDGVNVNYSMVRRGAAYVYERYVDSPVLDELQNAAREAAVGVWRLTEAERIRPWLWRRGVRTVERIDWEGTADTVDDALKVVGEKAADAWTAVQRWLRLE